MVRTRSDARQTAADIDQPIEVNCLHWPQALIMIKRDNRIELAIEPASKE